METARKGSRNVLGRGLSALISSRPVPVDAGQAPPAAEPIPQVTAPELKLAPENHSDGSPQIRSLEISQISANPTQPRQYFNEAELKELSESIKALGVIQPILVRPAKDGAGDQFEIIAGERRWRAAKLAGLSRLPAIIQPISDREAAEISLVENVQRADLNPIEEARAYQRLADEFKLSQQEIAERVGKDRASVSNFIRILKLPEPVIKFIEEGKLSLGHSKAILTIREPSAQLSLAKKAIAESLSVRALEGIVSRVVVLDAGKRAVNKTGPGEVTNGDVFTVNAFPEVVDRMRRILGTKVTVKHHNSGRGRLEIDYFSEQELDRIVELICHRDSR